ncbi:NAD(P)-binding protein [candidate division GN15 bacterium]|nr:NAD(P)-binding protein [candidate division GN15 bacterium]
MNKATVTNHTNAGQKKTRASESAWVREGRDSDRPHRIVIVGGGFGGLWAARRLRGADAEVVLIDRQNYHLFQPLLYQVATGGLSPADIASPFRNVLSKQHNARVILGNVTGIDHDNQQVLLDDGRLDFDSLIIATGSKEHYFSHPEWQDHVFGLKGIEDALSFRRQLYGAFERAEKTSDPFERDRLLTFVICGGGPTGVEMAGAIGEVARSTLPKCYRVLDTTDIRIILVEFMDQVLPSFPRSLAEAARGSLERLGVDVRTGTMVTDIDPEGAIVKVADQDEPSNHEVRIPASTVMWAAGVRSTAIGEALVGDDSSLLDKKGRVHVANDLSVPGRPNVFVIGDLANFSHQTGDPLPGVASVAMSQGKHVAKLIRRRLQGKDTKPYHYRDKGQLAVIGRASAVADLGKLKLSGYPAWLIWLFVHLMYLVEYENRLLVFIQWAWDYFTRKPGAQLITDKGAGQEQGYGEDE